MTLVKAYEMSLLATIFLDLWASYASWRKKHQQAVTGRPTLRRTRRKPNMMHPTNSHRPTSKGTATQSLVFGQSLKIWLDHCLEVNMVMAVKISRT